MSCIESMIYFLKPSLNGEINVYRKGVIYLMQYGGIETYSDWLFTCKQELWLPNKKQSQLKFCVNLQ